MSTDKERGASAALPPRRVAWFAHLRRSLGLLVVGLLVGGLATGWVVARLTAPRAPVASISTATRDEQIITAIVREQQVVLLSLGVQGILSRETHGQLFGKDVPGTGRQVFLQYGYRAKLGIDGGDVEVRRVDERTLHVTIPDFIFIGHEDEKFETIVEKNGVFSGVTPEIDKVQLINEILNDRSKAEQVNLNREWLQDQAKEFYEGIVHGIDKDVTLEFEFRRA